MKINNFLNPFNSLLFTFAYLICSLLAVNTYGQNSNYIVLGDASGVKVSNYEQ